MPPYPYNYEEDDECFCEQCEIARNDHSLMALDDAVWRWRERLSLTTLDDCAERLAQEASLFLVTRHAS